MKQGTEDLQQALMKLGEKIYQAAGGDAAAAGAQQAQQPNPDDFAGYGSESVNPDQGPDGDGFKNAGGDF